RLYAAKGEEPPEMAMDADPRSRKASRMAFAIRALASRAACAASGVAMRSPGTTLVTTKDLVFSSVDGQTIFDDLLGERDGLVERRIIRAAMERSLEPLCRFVLPETNALLE